MIKDAQDIKALADQVDNPNDLGMLINELLNRLDVMALEPYNSPAFGEVEAYDMAAYQISDENETVLETLTGSVATTREWK